VFLAVRSAPPPSQKGEKKTRRGTNQSPKKRPVECGAGANDKRRFAPQVLVVKKKQKVQGRRAVREKTISESWIPVNQQGQFKRGGKATAEQEEYTLTEGKRYGIHLLTGRRFEVTREIAGKSSHPEDAAKESQEGGGLGRLPIEESHPKH